MVWGLRPDKYTLAHARALQAPVWGQDSVESPEDYLRRRTAIEFLLKVRSQAEPWETALARQLERQASGSAEELIRHLDLTAGELQTVQTRCSKIAAETLARTAASRADLKRVVVNGRAVRETPAGWSVEKTGEVISNAILRLEHLVCSPNGSSPYYRGTVLYQDRQLPFAVSQRELERAPIDWLQRLLREHKLGEPICNRRWSSQLVNLARQFYQPVVLHETTRCGWDSENQAFVFPRFTLQRGGVILPHPVPSRASMPCKSILAPTGKLSDEEVRRLNGSKDLVGAVPLAWAAILYAAYNFTSPVCNRRRYGLFVHGPGAPLVRELLTAIGCTAYTAMQAVKPERLCKAGLPLLLRGSARLFRQMGTVGAAPNCAVFNLQDPLSMLWRANGRWGLLLAPSRPRCSPETIAAVAKVLPLFCQHLLTRPPRAYNPRWLAWHDMAEWFTSQGGSADAVKQGNDLLQPPGCLPALGDFMHWMLSHQHIVSEPAGFRTETTGLRLVTYPSQGLVWLPVDGLNEFLVSHGWPALHWPEIEKRSRTSRKPDWKKGEKYLYGNGWLVPERWWERSVNRARYKQSRLYSQ